MIKCLGFGLVFNQVPEQFIEQHAQVTRILSFHLTNTYKPNAKVSGVSKLNKHKHFGIYIYCPCIHTFVYIEIKITSCYHILKQKITVHEHCCCYQSSMFVAEKVNLIIINRSLKNHSIHCLALDLKIPLNIIFLIHSSSE